MILSDKFVYLHLPKTGGTFVTETLKEVDQRFGGLNIREVPGAKHSGVARVPDAYRDKPVIISVRNVFEHYVSRYAFRWWAEPEHADRMFDLEQVKRDYPRFPDLTLDEFIRFFSNWEYRRRAVRRGQAPILAQKQIGFNTWALCRISMTSPMPFLRRFDDYSDERVRGAFAHARFLPTERLNRALYDVLIGLGYEPDDLQFILESGPILPKRGGRAAVDTWREHFHDELIDFVVKRDRLYFRLFPAMKPDRS